MKTFSHLRQYLAELFLECEILLIKDVEEIKTTILFLVNFFSNNRAVYEIMSKN
jgi:hypothetical protein